MIRRTLWSWFLDCQCDFLSGTGAEKEHSKPRHAELDARARCQGPGRGTSHALPLRQRRRPNPGARSTLAAAPRVATAHTQRAQVRGHRKTVELKRTLKRTFLYRRLHHETRSSLRAFVRRVRD